jgi:hypothetical protein
LGDDGRTVFAATYERRRRAFGFVGGGPGSGLWRSLDGGGTWTRLFRRVSPKPPVNELEYRTCATATRADARTAADRMQKLRQSYWRKRLETGRAARGWPSN